jgi:1-deoxy-D-xylulose-5-phosphate reductoisomerase
MAGVQLDGTAGLRPLVVLGATGSIGRQTLDVAHRLGLEVAVLAARRPSDDLLALAADHPDAAIVVADDAPAGRDEVRDALGSRAAFGSTALVAAAATPGAIVVNGIVGAAGLPPSVAALEAGNRLALANKESLVAGGPVVLEAVRRGGGELIPVDSEHSALWQCLVGEDREAIRRLILTASGGPFRGRSREQLAGVTVAEALDHPTWSMGPRITVDSATLMNKAFEVIEAHHLFGVGYDRIAVTVHPQSVVHSLVEFTDGSVKAQLGDPDMRIPIQYAITHPGRVQAPVRELDLAGRALGFEDPDRDAFPCLDLGYAAGRAGGSAPAVLNAADEVAVAAFLEGRIGFPGIPAVVSAALEAVPVGPVESVEQVMEADRAARAAASSAVDRLARR